LHFSTGTAVRVYEVNVDLRFQDICSVHTGYIKDKQWTPTGAGPMLHEEEEEEEAYR